MFYKLFILLPLIRCLKYMETWSAIRAIFNVKTLFSFHIIISTLLFINVSHVRIIIKQNKHILCSRFHYHHPSCLPLNVWILEGLNNNLAFSTWNSCIPAFLPKIYASFPIRIKLQHIFKGKKVSLRNTVHICI